MGVEGGGFSGSGGGGGFSGSRKGFDGKKGV